ncbi:MAG: PQQ-binding-like beta-propeller repeat protein [Gammaproteobacteria bacterium]|jgi:polyvinyl alcohol dehydrogenase (cytochrome)
MLLAVAQPAFSQPAADGEAVFDQTCAACHGNPDIADAPGIEIMRDFPAGGIVNSLVNGKMQPQGALLSDEEQIAVAEFITGRPVDRNAGFFANRCTNAAPLGSPAPRTDWNGWGNGLANRRFAVNGGLTAADLSNLELKWAFGYADVVSARAQPTYVSGRLFVASENGEVHALDPKTGCTVWTFKADAGVRTALVIGPYDTAEGTAGLAAYFGDMTANAYAVDASSGELIWKVELDSHPGAAITGPPAVYDGRVYVPIQGLNEEGSVVRVDGQCCTFRGHIDALDAHTGELIWRSFTIDEPQPRGENAEGVTGYGPAGGGIWAPPTIDPAREALYIATGNGYADPPQPTTDAVIAIDLATGTHRWVNQVTPNDQWAGGCRPENPDNPLCPEAMGPDHDFSSPPTLVAVDGRDLLVLPQKSGLTYAIDADTGELVWQYRIGAGTGLGGQWGGSTDGQNFYVGVSDMTSANPGGIHAIDLASGEQAWYAPPTDPLCADAPQCRPAQGAATTLIPGAVFSGSLDGGMRAYSTEDGTLLWLFDTNREFETVNGIEAKGGSMDGPGVTVADGMLYFNSGYGGFGRNAGNVLLAFGPAD